MMKRLALSFWISLLAAASPALLAAQTIPSPYRYVERVHSLELFGGYLWTDRGEIGLGPASAPVGGIAYAGRFGGPVAGLLRFSAIPSERTVFVRPAGSDLSAPPPALLDRDALLLLGEAGLRLNLTGPRTYRGLAPYLAATGGYAFNVSGRAPEESEIAQTQVADLGPGLAVGLFAGTDWFLTERLSLRLSAQDHLWRISTPAGLASTGEEETEWTNNLGVTLGVALHF